ncbi:MAG: fumarylacetoacetase [Bacteroidetes bacterium]|nr:fumarylacetoacetase [Bacteroidota bacterium]
MEIKANNPNLKSWVEVSAQSDFSIQNIPFGIYTDKEATHHACTAIGEYILDLHEAHQLGYFKDLNLPNAIFSQKHLNDFIALGKETTRRVRNRISDLLNLENNELQHAAHKNKILKKQSEVRMLIPVHIGDYTDFYSSIDHATNVGKMFRDPENALLPNWKHLPVGYHGRASSIRVSGHSFHRPKGQSKPNPNEPPVFGPCKLLDFELETAFIIGKNTEMGHSISTEKADDSIFGMVLFNDWSARDIQTWEYVPLGPFLAKNFASTISPWIVTLDALEPFRTKGYEQEPKVLPYLQYTGNKNIDINLEVLIQPENTDATVVSESNYKYMYWTMEQQLAHHTVNGCNVQVGDMMASGTISGTEKHQFGSMLELTWRGANPIKMNDGSERKFINDNDTVIMKGWCQKEGVRVGFGECKAKVLPAL